MTGIYSIYNLITGKYYIGQTIDIENRWMQHKSRLKCQTHENKHLQASYNKYHKENFVYSVIEECAKEDLNEKEKYYIQKYDSYCNGYNQDTGGAGCPGYKHTEEEILKMRKIQNPKAILQLDMNLNIINEWISCSHAGKTLNISIRGIKACCNRVNHQKTLGGYYWMYKDEYDNGTVDWDYYLNINKSNFKRVSQYDFNMNLIAVYDSISDAGIKTGFSVSEISAVCNHKKKTYKKYVWRFTDYYSEEEYKQDCKIDFAKRPVVGAKSISRYDLSGNLVCVYKSIADAVRKTGFSKSSITVCLYGKKEKSHDSTWKYNN